MKNKAITLTCAAIICGVLTLHLSGETRPSPPKHSDIAGVWVNLGMRLELETNGTGYFSHTFPQPHGETYLYVVERWTLSDFAIRIDLRPVGDAPPRQITDLKYSGKGLEFNRTREPIRLWPEAEYQGMFERAKDAITSRRKLQSSGKLP